MVPPTGTADSNENAAWYINVFFVAYKCDLDWHVGLVRSSHTADDCTQDYLLLLQTRLVMKQIKSSFRCDAIEFIWAGGERLAGDMATCESVSQQPEDDREISQSAL